MSNTISPTLLMALWAVAIAAAATPSRHSLLLLSPPLALLLCHLLCPHLVAQVAGHTHEQSPHQRCLQQRRDRHVVLALAVDAAPAGRAGAAHRESEGIVVGGWVGGWAEGVLEAGASRIDDDAHHPPYTLRLTTRPPLT